MDSRNLKEKLKGIVFIAMTPMNEDRSINYSSFKNLLKTVVNTGINSSNGAVVIGGSSGECGALNLEERKKLFYAAMEAAGDSIPVIAGCNHSDSNQVVELAQYAEKIGASGIMVLSPYYYGANSEIAMAFYKYLSSQTNLGIMLYNNLEVTKYDIPVNVLSELSETTNVVGIKECTPYFWKLDKMVRELGDKISIINGNGEFFEPYSGLAGAKGFISTVCNFAPQIVLDMWTAISKGDYEKAKKARNRLLPFMDYAMELAMQGGEPKVLALIKKAADLTGLNFGPGRIPVLELAQEETDRLAEVLKKMDLV